MAASLLDTMALLWMGLRPDLLGAKARKAIESGCPLHYSIVSLWEIGIKMSGKGFQNFTLPPGWETLIPQQLNERGIPCLQVQPSHCRRIQDLPFHHKDPFDRMLIAQAMDGNLTIIGCDDTFDAYGVKRVW